MNPWDKSRQTIRLNIARPCTAPQWANNIDRGTVTRSGTHYFLMVPHVDDLAFELCLSEVTVHQQDGKIPTRTSSSVIKPLHSNLEIPYTQNVSDALADYALTMALHELMPSSKRISIEHMDGASWTILLHDLNDMYAKPAEVCSADVIGTSGSDLTQCLEAAVSTYRESPFALPEHNAVPEYFTPETSTVKTGKRFGLRRLFR